MSYLNNNDINGDILRLFYQILDTYLQKKNSEKGILKSGQNKTQDNSVDNSTESFKEMIDTAAAKYNIDPKLVQAVVQTESNFKADAISPAGAKGLMQLMPGTAAELGVQNALDPQQNLDGGVKYLKELLDSNQGNVETALAAYNAGPGAVKEYGGIPPYQETKTYIKRVLDQYQQNDVRRS